MKIDVFAYWYIKKHLYPMANTDSVVYDVYNDGTYRRTISNSEYRRTKKKLEKEGYIVNSRNMECSFEDIISENIISEEK